MSESWPDVRQRYLHVNGDPQWAKDMADLVAHIEGSPLGRSLHAWTSMFDLCISQTPPCYPSAPPHLRISPQTDGKLEFSYIDTDIRDKQWHRIVRSNEAIERFSRFIEQLHWAGK